jgi:hypothetical protein
MQAALAAGLPQVKHPAMAPGGQVFAIAPQA